MVACSWVDRYHHIGYIPDRSNIFLFLFLVMQMIPDPPFAGLTGFTICMFWHDTRPFDRWEELPSTYTDEALHIEIPLQVLLMYAGSCMAEPCCCSFAIHPIRHP